jgi:hypothetical protein
MLFTMEYPHWITVAEMSASWTPEEDRLLRTMAVAGESTAAIGMLLKRTASSVRNRARLLKIKTIRSRPGPEGAAFLMAPPLRGKRQPGGGRYVVLIARATDESSILRNGTRRDHGRATLTLTGESAFGL